MIDKVIVTSFSRGEAVLRDPAACPAGRNRMAAGHVADRHRMVALLDDPWHHQDTCWDVSVINGSYCLDPRMRSLQVKVGFGFSKLGASADASLWVDPDVEFRDDLSLDVLVGSYMGSSDLCAFRHPAHDCAYAYAEDLCARVPLYATSIREQVEKYRREGFPEGRGLYDTSVLLRRHTPKMKAACELWWRELLLGYPDPALSLPYALWCAEDARASLFPGQVGPDFTSDVLPDLLKMANSNPYFRRRP